MGKFIDLTGQRFGRLIVVERSNDSIDTQVQWICQCDCGRTTIIRGTNLRGGHTKSCGCLSPHSQPKEHFATRITHGMTGTRLYKIYKDMLARCTNPNVKDYPYYGGKGVCVCDEWHDSNRFIDWALKTGYQDNLTIDRIDVNGNYEPSNCRWVTRKRQMRNRSNTIFIVYDGKTLPLAEWADELNMPYQTLYNRLYTGWSIEEALTIPPGGKRPKK